MAENALSPQRLPLVLIIVFYIAHIVALAFQGANHPVKIRRLHAQKNLCQIHHLRRNDHNVADVAPLLGDQLADLPDHPTDIIGVNRHGIVLVAKNLLIFLEHRLLRHDSKQQISLTRNRKKARLGGDKLCCCLLAPRILMDRIDFASHEITHLLGAKLLSGTLIIPKVLLKHILL